MSDMADKDQSEEALEVQDEIESTDEVESKDEAEVVPEDDDGEVIVSIGDAPPAPDEEEHAQAPTWVNELRKSHREIQRENRELKEKLKAKEAPASEAVITLGKEPELEDCDYDPDRFKQEWKEWNNKRSAIEKKEAEARAKADEETKAWQAKLDAYAAAKAKLKVANYDEAEHVLKETLSPNQQGIIINGADNPALLVYALGKNPEKAKELAAITDPIKYAFALAKLEVQLKVTKRSAPAPDRPVSSKGAASLSGAVDSTLDRLRTEAERTGDYTKVHEYRRQKRSQ